MSKRVTHDVLIDMDNTLFDFDAPILESIGTTDRVERANFYITEDYPADLHEQIKQIYNDPEFFCNLDLKEGAVEAWQAMLDNGYNPIIASAPLTSNPSAVEGKRLSLKRTLAKEFGSSVLENAIFDKEKWKYPGVALIDDRPHVPRGPGGGEDLASWQHVLFGWQHPATVPMSTAAFRLLSWRDSAEVIQTLDTIRGSMEAE
ncbi:MAG: hypothetical protein UY35_C0004G0029 [Candidatus Saccharibacteria bacterium GW2011_GWC2_48_9]|nr:MAG: hypothetical protein UY35_C0004G0029 [Candidatus Saccharibacteria bacterium GW2011_GWC2_48_9]